MGQSFKAKISLGRNSYPAESVKHQKLLFVFFREKIYQHTSMLEPNPNISMRILASKVLPSRYFGRGINKVQNLSTTENEVKVT